METFIKFFMGLGKPEYDINNVALFGPDRGATVNLVWPEPFCSYILALQLFSLALEPKPQKNIKINKNASVK